jgi:cobalamin biosynthesis Mg chelatase CobN
MIKLRAGLLVLWHLSCIAFTVTANNSSSTGNEHHTGHTSNNTTHTPSNNTAHHVSNNTEHHSSNTSEHLSSGKSTTVQSEHPTAVLPQAICVHNDTCHHSGRCVAVERHDRSLSNECHCTAGYKGSNCKDVCSLHCENGGYCEPPTHHSQRLRFLSNGTIDKCVCPVGFSGHLCGKNVAKQPNDNDSKDTSNDASASSSSSSSQVASGTSGTAKAGIFIAIFVFSLVAFVFYRRRQKARAVATQSSSGFDNQKTIESDITYRDSECELDVDPLDDDKWNNTKELS